MEKFNERTPEAYQALKAAHVRDLPFRLRRTRLADRRQTLDKIALDEPARELLEISEFFRNLLRSDIQAGPTRQCPLDGYDVSWMRISLCNERWRVWEAWTARSQR